MSNYPFSIDNNITLPGVSGSTQEDVAITALRSAVFAIETELGVTPSGIYPDVRTRLDILESRIQFGVSPQIPNDGYVKSPLFIWNVPGNVILSVSDGYGAPTESRLRGSLYMRADGPVNNQLYVNISPGGPIPGNSWSPVQTEQFQAHNDLTGFPLGTDGHLAQTVIGLFNHPLNPNMNLLGSVQDGYHLTWDFFDGYWEPQTGFIPGRDLAAFSGPYGRTAQTVIGLQGSPISPTAPQDGYVLVWESIDGHWEPQHRSVIFAGSVASGDGYVTRTNITSNKILQSPTTNNTGLIGMVNFGTSTNGSGGTSNNYATLLGGDRGTASGLFSLVAGGYSNTASDGYSTVVNGSGNAAGAGGTANAVVLNGTNNTANGVQSTVLNGTSNTASGTNSNINNGTSNSTSANFSSILNGATNTISAGSTHSSIGFGSNNTISGGAASTFSILLGGTGNSIVSAQNALLGPASTSTMLGNYSVLLSGTSNTITTLSDYAVVLTGINNNISGGSAKFGFIGTGQNNTISGGGYFTTIFNADSGTANGNHATVLKGFNNSATGQFTTIINGQNNTINSAGWGLILDGYANSVTGTGSFIADGYSNSVSGFFSSILNGNTNTISARNSTILNGASNIMDSLSAESTVIVGSNNTFTNSANTTATGSGNTFTNATATFVIGTLNTIQSAASFVNGTNNTLSSGSTNSRVFGSNNIFGTSSSINFAIGNGNNIGPTTVTSNTFSFGSNNIIDGAVGGFISGNQNIALANLTNIHGQFGKSRMFGQEVRANSRFTSTTIAPASNGQTLPQGTINVVSTAGFPTNGTIAIVTSAGLQTVSYTSTSGTQFLGCTSGTGTMTTGGQVGKIGEAQWSRLILTGTSTGGAAIPLQLQDTLATNPTFVDGYSYDMSIKLLIVNTSNLVQNGGQNQPVPARHYIDVLAHQESGVLIIDNINFTVSTPNTSDSPFRTPWTVTVTSVGNQLVLQVDLEAPSSYVQPGNGPSSRRAIASIDMREISRI